MVLGLSAGFDATVIGVPFDGGCTYRAGTRFGPQGIRRISALYTPYNYEMGIDLREQMSLCDAGDVFTIPANLEKSFDQVSKMSLIRRLSRMNEMSSISISVSNHNVSS